MGWGVFSLDKTKTLDNTMIFFLSDNGGTSKNASRNTPLRGWKSDVFEGGLRVPFAMMWKNKIKGGQVYEKPVISLDIMASIAAEAGLEASKDRPFDGVNLVPYLMGKKDGRPHQTLFWRKKEQGQTMAIRSGDDKLLIENKLQGAPQLYHLKKDKQERHNLVKSKPEKVEALIKQWQDWNSNLKDRYFPTLAEDKWWE
jgi:arylsulfatase A-like enzyme